MAGAVLEVGPFQHGELDKEEPPSVTALKLKQKLQELRGQSAQVKLVSVAGAAPLADDAFCELDGVGAEDAEVRYQCLMDTIPDQLFVLVSTFGDEGCPRVCTQEVSVKGPFLTKRAAAAFIKADKRDSDSGESESDCSDRQPEWEIRRLSFTKIKACPEAMSKLGDHVYALLKVETDSGQPQYPYSRFYTFLFVDKASAADLAVKFYHSSLWGKTNASNDYGLRDCESTLDSDFETNSDCEDYTQDLSRMNDDIVLQTYGTSIRIVKFSLSEASGEAELQHPKEKKEHEELSKRVKEQQPEEREPSSCSSEEEELQEPSSANQISSSSFLRLDGLAPEVEHQMYGKWESDKGTCRIFRDGKVNRLAYEEPLDDDESERLHGWLDPVLGEAAVWIGLLGILQKGEQATISTKVVGKIRIRPLPAALGAAAEDDLLAAAMQTEVMVYGEEEQNSWDEPVRFSWAGEA
mmetsp:Transcript_22394/g.46402  ORF Transcript_22394/g.46402 Transcript_22394/m.46402 type:complete len:466 (+) Transcript_22394:1-1398(+)